MENLSKKSIQQWISDEVKTDAHIPSDGCFVYKRISLLGSNHSSKIHWGPGLKKDDRETGYFFEPSADSGTQNIENIWDVLKRGFKGAYIHAASHYLGYKSLEYA